MSNMLEAVRLWLKSSPILKNDRIGIDYLSNEADSWAVAMSPTQPVVKKYINGAYIGQYDSRLNYDYYSYEELIVPAGSIRFSLNNDSGYHIATYQLYRIENGQQYLVEAKQTDVGFGNDSDYSHNSSNKCFLPFCYGWWAINK